MDCLGPLLVGTRQNGYTEIIMTQTVHYYVKETGNISLMTLITLIFVDILNRVFKVQVQKSKIAKMHWKTYSFRFILYLLG